MNAPANIPPARVTPEGFFIPYVEPEFREWTPAERAHRSAISIHCPNEDEWSMKCRVAIAMMRDQAAAAQRQCSDASLGILVEVARIATGAVFAPSSAKRLTLMRSALVQAMDAARAIERASRNG